MLSHFPTISGTVYAPRMSRPSPSHTIPPALTPPKPGTTFTRADAIAEEAIFAQSILRTQAAAVANVAHTLADTFHRAVDILETCAENSGTVLVTGLGKSGHIGAKISATLASLGVPSHPVHPTEAVHGDLGRFRASDAVICISASGETEEVVSLALTLRQDGLKIIAITAKGSASAATRPSLARAADVWLTLDLDQEAGHPEFLAPTSSTTATLALGDALALAVARRRRFTDADFAKRHPGGSLGGLLRPVMDVLRFRVSSSGNPDNRNSLPLIPHNLSVASALNQAAQAGRRPGAMLLVDPVTGALTGIFTDGDLRRLVLRDLRAMDEPIERVMTRSPRTLPHTALVRDAVHMVKEFRQDEIPIVDDLHRPVGLLDVQDLIAMRLVRE
jgi:arabinose-5-phosphate isomerase